MARKIRAHTLSTSRAIHFCADIRMRNRWPVLDEKLAVCAHVCRFRVVSAATGGRHGSSLFIPGSVSLLLLHSTMCWYERGAAQVNHIASYTHN